MLGYVTEDYDVIRLKSLNKIDMAIQRNLEKGNKCFAVGVYSKELCEELGLGTPLKSVEDRMRIISSVSGVNFAFEVDDLDPKAIEVRAKEGLAKFLAEKDKPSDKPPEKKYGIVYAPGTYDIFHAGHLEHLLIAASESEMVVAGVKADELVKAHKGRYPLISGQERMEILRHFRMIKNVYQYYTRNPHTAINWIQNRYQKK